MSDSLRTYLIFWQCRVYIWGIAADSVFPLFVWIVPSLKKRAEAGRVCRLAGVDTPFTGTRKSYLSGMTHVPKTRHIPEPPSPPRVSGARPGAPASGGLVDVTL